MIQSDRKLMYFSLWKMIAKKFDEICVNIDTITDDIFSNERIKSKSIKISAKIMILPNAITMKMPQCTCKNKTENSNTQQRKNGTAKKK